MANHDDDHDDDRRGLSDIARSVLDHGSEYIEARIDLAKLEADEAADHAKGLSARLGVGTFAASAGYTICVVSLVALISRHFADGRWEIPALIVGVLHLILGGLFLLGAKRQAKLTRNLFSSTRRELSKDQQWLKQKSQFGSDDAPN